MPKLTSITTRRGDGGETDLSSGKRAPKDSPRIQAIGSIDELTSVIGLALSFTPQQPTADLLRRIQNDLFQLGATISRSQGAESAGPKILPTHIEILEREIRALQERLGPLENFLLPDGTSCAAALQLARAVCRRAERDLVALNRAEPVEEPARIYLNRLSDLLFLLGRQENKAAGKTEALWDSKV